MTGYPGRVKGPRDRPGVEALSPGLPEIKEKVTVTVARLFASGLWRTPGAPFKLS